MATSTPPKRSPLVGAATTPVSRLRHQQQLQQAINLVPSLHLPPHSQVHIPQHHQHHHLQQQQHQRRWQPAASLTPRRVVVALALLAFVSLFLSTPTLPLLGMRSHDDILREEARTTSTRGGGSSGRSGGDSVGSGGGGSGGSSKRETGSFPEALIATREKAAATMGSWPPCPQDDHDDTDAHLEVSRRNIPLHRAESMASARRRLSQAVALDDAAGVEEKTEDDAKSVEGKTEDDAEELEEADVENQARQKRKKKKKRKGKGRGKKFIMVQLTGGLNQMRAGLCDAVVVARVLGASLVLPSLDRLSWWADGSRFEDVFDVRHLVTTLADKVSIVLSLPRKLKGRVLERVAPRGSTPEDYRSTFARLLRKHRVILFNHFESRLADNIAPHLQRLRCRTNYQALRFVEPVQQAAAAVIAAVRSGQPTAAAAASAGVASAVEPARPYVAVHLRFEADMLAFSGCEYGGTAEQRAELLVIRKRWPTLPPWNPLLQRSKGLCVVTPAEVGRALQALGIPPFARVYVASGALYGGTENALSPLRHLYHNLITKSDALTLTGSSHSGGVLRRMLQLEEGDSKAVGASDKQGFSALQRILTGNLSTLQAAVDYEVCRAADVFVANNNGNMARLLGGHRRRMGLSGTMKLFGSGAFKLLAKADEGDERAAQRLSQRMLQSGSPSLLVPQTGHALSGNASSGHLSSSGRITFYEFPRDCLCRTEQDHIAR